MGVTQVGLLVLVACVAGVGLHRRWGEAADRVSRRVLELVLLFVLPPTYFVLVSRLEIRLELAAGLAVGYVVLLCVGVIAWWVSSRLLHLPRTTVGAVVLAVVLVNTGYFGIPVTRATLGVDALPDAVAWDGLISSPMTFIVGYAIGAAFGTLPGHKTGPSARLLAFLRNPVLAASFIGIAVPWRAPVELAEVATALIIGILPLGFVVVGIQVSTGAAERRARRDQAAEGGELARAERLAPAVGLVVVLRHLVAPGIALLVSALAVPLSDAMKLQAAMPSGLNALLIANRFRLSLAPAAAAIVATTTIVCVTAALYGLL